VDAVIGILAVLKSGGAYVPMDASYPVDRLAYMLRDSEASVVLAPPSDTADWIPRDVNIIRWGSAEESRDPDWKNSVQPNDVAFIVYTSGSTGDPKGVTTTHASMCAYLGSLRHALQVGEGDVFLHTASLAFSSSNRQLFLPLCGGSTVVMAAREDIADPIRLFGLIKTQRITVIDVVPSFWRGCIAALADLDEQVRRSLLENDLRLVLSASEALPSEVVGRWRSLNHPARLVNMYGMTETTGIVTTYAIPDAIGDESYLGVVPIGRPIDGVEYRILDSVSASDDSVGELYIAGPTLAGGYYNRPELTDRSFIVEDGTVRFYRTGDICRLRADGVLEHIGRADRQMKIRGFRIEPREIEHCLEEHPGVREAVVSAVELCGERRLVAYCVPASPPGFPSVTEVRRFLSTRLPEYMVPAHYIELQRLPRTPNNKLDYKSLPVPSLEDLRIDDGQERPSRPPLEEKLARIWAEILGVRHVGSRQSFYELGGNSLSALRILSRVLDELGLSLSPSVLFEAPTVAAMAAHIQRLQVGSDR
jgi:amino acid adenylation domain-containing protein